MLERILHFSITHRFLIACGTIGLVIWGGISWSRLNLDAVPDITTNQVVINTEAGGMGPEEVERTVTFPVESAMSGLPGVEGTRSISQYGLSQVTVTFRDDVDIYFARQLVSERLNAVNSQLPEHIDPPQMGPISTGLGDVYVLSLGSKERSIPDLRTIMDWQVSPQLRSVPGVAEVNVAHGKVRQYQVVADTSQLQGRGLGIHDLIEALRNNNQNAGGGVIEVNGERLLIRSLGTASTVRDIEAIPVSTEGGIPTLVGDVAEVKTGSPVLTGISTKDGREELVAVVMMLKGANGRTVAQAIDAKVEEIRSQLPPDVRLTTLYNRANLVNKTVRTVGLSLLEGGALVVIVLLLLLGNLSGALIVACSIPLSMLAAVGMMNHWGISGNLMSLGAIDFGLIVDGAVVMVENAVRRVAEARESAGRTLSRLEVRDIVFRSSREVAKPTAFAVLIITAVYLPILALEGTEGKMFRPMAFTVVFALLGALALTVTLIPALASVFLSGDTRETKNALMSALTRAYDSGLAVALRARPLILTCSALLVALVGWLSSSLGAEFVPTLDEGDLVVQPIRIRTAGAEETLRLVTAAEKKVLEVPEVETIFSRSGTPEIATDPMPLSLTDSYIILKERDKWRPAMTKETIREEIESKLKQVPGQGYSFSQPIELRFNELVSGVKADIGIKVFGTDLEVLRKKAEEIRNIVSSIPGAADVEVEQVEPIPVLQIAIDRDAIGRYGVSIKEVQELIGIALGGEEIGQILEGDKRYDLIVRVPEEVRSDPEYISDLPVKLANGESVPLSSLAKVEYVFAPAQISRESGKRRVVVQLNVKGRDLAGFVARAQRAIRDEVKLDEGYYITWGGQFEKLSQANARLMIVVPITLAIIFALLYLAFGSIRQALMIFSGVPLAITGGILALWIRDMPFSISAAVGFIALSGVAVLNGVVMISAINQLRQERNISAAEAAHSGAVGRLRPVLMTALVAALGFIPMALNTGIGAEVQRPLATVVIGGIVSSTLLTLLVLPLLYAWFERDRSSN